MKKTLLIVLAVLAMASFAYAASVERYHVVLPVGPDGADGGNDSTYASMAALSNAIDLSQKEVSKLRYLVGWTKSSDIDTLHIIARTSMDGTTWTVIDSQTAVASGTKTHFFSVSDTGAVNLQKYFQVYVKLAAVDNANAVRPQAVDAYVTYFNGLGDWIGWAGRKVQSWLTE